MSLMKKRGLFFATCVVVAVVGTPLAFGGSRGHSTRSRSALTRSASPSTTSTGQSSATVQHRRAAANLPNRAFHRGTTRFGDRNAFWNHGGRSFTRGTANLRHWNGNWRRRHRDRVIIISRFGFPYYSPFFYSSYPYSYYPYSYYSYGYDPYGYGYSSYSSYPYNTVYQGGGTYDDDPRYSDDADYYYDSSDGRSDGSNSSIVSQVQRSLAREGYYKGAIDGVIGPRTHYAIRAYQRAHNLRVDGTVNDQLLNNLGLR